MRDKGGCGPLTCSSSSKTGWRPLPPAPPLQQQQQLHTSPPPFPHTCSGSSEIDVIIAVITSGVMLVMPAMPVPAQQMCE